MPQGDRDQGSNNGKHEKREPWHAGLMLLVRDESVQGGETIEYRPCVSILPGRRACIMPSDAQPDDVVRLDVIGAAPGIEYQLGCFGNGFQVVSGMVR